MTAILVHDLTPLTDDEILAAAARILEERARALSQREILTSPSIVREALRCRLAGREREAFVVMLLDAQHRLLATEELFQGTLQQTAVFPREVVKCALRYNAAAVILAHNHPSGVAEPSHADQRLTENLKAALALVDVKVLDHFIAGSGALLSFAERGLL